MFPHRMCYSMCTWVDSNPVCVLSFGLTRPSQCNHKIYGILGDASMACGSQLKNILNHDDVLVVL